jgi:hypothetical protein
MGFLLLVCTDRPIPFWYTESSRKNNARLAPVDDVLVCVASRKMM